MRGRLGLSLALGLALVGCGAEPEPVSGELVSSEPATTPELDPALLRLDATARTKAPWLDRSMVRDMSV